MSNGARYYDIDGEKYPSVTTVLQSLSKPALSRWFVREERRLFLIALEDAIRDSAPLSELIERVPVIAEEIRQEESKANKSAAFGNALHAKVEWYLKRELGIKSEEPLLPSQKAMDSYTKWLVWWKASNLIPLHAEYQIHNHQYGYAGTLDLHAKGPSGKKYIVDWKTTKGIYAESFLQNIAYRHNENGIVSESGIIVKLPKSGRGAIKIVSVPESIVLDDFVACLRMWKWQQEYDKPWSK